MVTKVANPVPNTKPAFAFSDWTIEAIKEGADNYPKYCKALTNVKDDLFLYGIEGETTGKRLPYDERKIVHRIFDKIESALEYCHEWNFKKNAENKVWQMCNNSQYMTWESQKGDKSDMHYLDLVFEVSAFWKYKVDGDCPNTARVIPVLELQNWFIWICGAILQDHNDWSEENN